MSNAASNANGAPADVEVDLARAVPTGQLIDGAWVDGGGAVQVVLNPATEEPLAELASAAAADVDRAVRAAETAFAGWRRATPADRSRHLLRLADLVERRKGQLARTESLNVGKPIGDALAEVEEAVDGLRFFAGAGRTVEGRYAEPRAGASSIIRREPVGVAALITAWNFPLMGAVSKLGPALAAGNCCILKPSELTPLTTLMLASAAQEVYPPGVVNVVTGTGPEVGTMLLRHPGIRLVSLTGGVETGKVASRLGAETLKRMVLELGGNAPVIVFEDADLERVAERVARAAYKNAGQICLAASRVLAAGPVCEEVTERLADAAGRLRVGDPSRGEFDLGPVVSRRQQQRVLGLVEGAAGATIAHGGKALGDRGFFVEPTVLANVQASDEVVRQEVFGPVLTVQSFTSSDEAIAWANGVEYGLSASVWTRDGSRAMSVARDLEFGTVWLNEHLATAPDIPNGGFKHSGNGTVGSLRALDDMSQHKNIWVSYE